MPRATCVLLLLLCVATRVVLHACCSCGLLLMASVRSGMDKGDAEQRGRFIVAVLLSCSIVCLLSGFELA